jgi:hypothetical protein
VKALLIAGTALAVSAGPAVATTQIINLNGYCDVFTVTSQDGGSNVFSFVSMNTGCDDGFGFGGVSYYYADMGGILFAFDSYIWALQLSSPIQTNGVWILSDSADGKHFTRVNSGSYTVVTAGGPLRHQGKPASKGR